MSDASLHRVKVDAKRRPTLPQELLDAAGVSAGGDVVAHFESPGRIVLQAPATVLTQLQEAVRAGTHARESEAAAGEELTGDEVGQSAGPAPTDPDPAPADPDSTTGAEPDATVGAGR